MSVIGSVFGGDDDGALSDAAPCAPSSAEVLALELAVEEERPGANSPQAAALFLKEQTRLVRLQTAGYAEDQTLRLRHLHAQSRESRLRRIGQIIRIAIQVFTASVLTATGSGAVFMVYQALSSRSVIVESFDAPRDFAGGGLTGKVVASGLLDDLTLLQRATRANSKKRALTGAWVNTIKIAVPQTGVSIEDIDRALRNRLGHDIHINGDLVAPRNGGLRLAVRGDGLTPKTFIGGGDDLDKLTMQAAEYVYGQAEPALYDGYLVNVGRNADAVAFSRGAYGTVADSERPSILDSWANAIEDTGGSLDEAQRLYQEALRLKPAYWVAYVNLMNVDLMRGDEEGVWQVGEALRHAAGGRPGRAGDFAYQNLDSVTWNLLTWREALRNDAEKHMGIGTSTVAEQPLIAAIDVSLHDEASARILLQLAQADPSDPSVVALAHFIRGRLALDAGDAATAAAEMEQFGRAFADPKISSNFSGYDCWIAPAEEAAGHPDRADAVLKRAGHFVDCDRFRGDILDHRGDWSGARKAYADAVALAPHLPAGHYSWGLALDRRNDFAGAVRELAAANARGPHWADPLKAWGDILARRGRWTEALEKYDQALTLAPAWTDLHAAHAIAVAHLAKTAKQGGL